MTCPGCGEPVEAGERFFELEGGRRAHEHCVMRRLRIEHSESVRIDVFDISKVPAACPAGCVDGLLRDERCSTCGGTGERDRVVENLGASDGRANDAE